METDAIGAQRVTLKKFVLVSLLAMTAMSVWAQSWTNKFYSASSKGYWSADVGYPQFEGASCAQMNIMIARKARETFDAFVADCKKFFKDNPKRPYAEWQLTVTPNVLLAKNGVVSFKSLDFRFTGGAHPNTVISTQNYALKTGQYRTIGLKDVMNAVSSRETFAKQAVLPALENVKKGRGATPVDGFNVAMLDDFGFTDKGLVFFFSHYEVGPYAEGSFEVTVPWIIAGEYLNRSGVAKPFLEVSVERVVQAPVVYDFAGVVNVPSDASVVMLIRSVKNPEAAPFAMVGATYSPTSLKSAPVVRFIDVDMGTQYAVTFEIQSGDKVLYSSGVIQTTDGGWNEPKTVTFKKVG